MKKRVFSVLLVLCMVLSLMPALTIGAEAASLNKTLNLAMYADDSGDGWSWSSSTKTMTVSKPLTISSSSGAGLYFNNSSASEAVYLVLNADLTITGNPGLWAYYGNLHISGPGKLTINSSTQFCIQSGANMPKSTFGSLEIACGAVDFRTDYHYDTMTPRSYVIAFGGAITGSASILNKFTKEESYTSILGNQIPAGTTILTSTASSVITGYDITFNANGGSTTPTKLTAQTALPNPLPDPGTKTGYTFDKWYTDASYSKEATAGGSISSNTTLYAHWTAKTYTVTLNDNGGSGGSGTKTATYAQSIPQVNVPTREGYTFGGYYSDATQYMNASGVGVKAWTTDSAGTLTAKWLFNYAQGEKWNIDAVPSQTYTGSAITPDPVISCTQEGYAKSPLIKGTDYTLSYSGNTNVGGSATIDITFIGDYAGSASTTFSITQKTPTASDFNFTLPSGDGAIYTGNDIVPATITEKDGSLAGHFGIQYYSVSGSPETETLLTSAPNTIGKYRVKAVVSGSANFEACTAVLGDYTIAANTIGGLTDAFKDNTDLVYNATARGILVNKSALVLKGGQIPSITYKQADGSYSSDVPAFTDAGTYTVYWKVTAPNHTDATGSRTVTIARQPLTVTGVIAESKVYDTNQTATLSQASEWTKNGYIDSETLTVSCVGTFDNANVGTGKTVSLAFSLADGTNGGKAANYELKSDCQASTTATITCKPIVAQWKTTRFVYDGSAKNPEYDIVGLCDGDTTTVLNFAGASAAVGIHTLTATPSNLNYALSNSKVDMSIEKAPVSFTVTGNSCEVGAADTLSVASDPAVSYTLSYRNSKGEVSATKPTEAGDYDILATITSANYRHESGADGGAKKIGVLEIRAAAAEPRTYKVKFAAGNGAEGEKTEVTGNLAGDIYIVPACSEFSKTNYAFTGWKFNNRIYQPGEKLEIPKNDVTLTAQWAEAFSVGVTVTNEAGGPIKDAVVTLKQNGEKKLQNITDALGEYTFPGILPGIYQMEVSYDGVERSVMVTVKDAAVQEQVIMPAKKLNTVIDIKAGTEIVAIGSLEKNFSDDDEVGANNGKTIVLTFTAIDMTAPADIAEKTAIEEKADNVAIYLDLSVKKTVDDTTTPIYETDELIDVVMNLPGELQGKGSYTLYRMHAPDENTPKELETITTSKNADGEYLELNKDKTALIAHLCKFSTYALGYTEATADGWYSVTVEKTAHGTASANPAFANVGSIVKITTVPDEGYSVHKVTVTDSSGNELAVTDLGDGKYCFTQPGNVVNVQVIFDCPSMKFTDLDLTRWYHKGIDYAVENKLMVGTSDTTFSPNAPTSRGMIATILWRMEGSPKVNEASSFEDVSADMYYAEAIKWAQDNGIVKGYDEQTFGPNDAITREQLAAIFYRYSAFKNQDMSAQAELSAFDDSGSISAYAKTAMAWAASKGLIQGVTETTLDPAGNATRAQVAAILMRYCGGTAK